MAVGTEAFKNDDGEQEAKVKIWYELLYISVNISHYNRDLRNLNDANTLHELKESFGDDLTCVKFQPGSSSILATGSTDGLACVFDLNQMPDETEALRCVFNSGSSVNKVGFFGGNGTPASPDQYLYLMTHIETLSLWSLHTGGIVADLGDVRSVQSGIDYMIDCHFNRQKQTLTLACGSYEGSLYLANVSMKGLQMLHQEALGGHSSVVRSVLWDVAGSGDLITGGEDSRMIRWSHDNSRVEQRTVSTGKSTNSRLKQERSAPYRVQ